MSLSRSLKVHLRVLELHGVELRVVTLRSQTQARFSTNYYHDTWHIVSDAHGASVLGRLMWGLAFQRHPNTLVLIDGEHLVTTPFEGDRSDPIVLVPAGLTSVDLDLLRALKLRLRRAPGAPTTIRWHTFGMAAALEECDRFDPAHRAERERVESYERMSRRAGFVCYTAPPAILRDLGLGIYGMSREGEFPFADFAPRCGYEYDGEFQIVTNFSDKVSAALVARREVIGDRSIASDAERHAIWDRTYATRARLHRARNE